MLSLVMFERRMNIRCKYSDMLQLNILSDPHFELFSSAAPPFVGTLDAGLGIISAKSFSSSPGSAQRTKRIVIQNFRTGLCGDQQIPAHRHRNGSAAAQNVGLTAFDKAILRVVHINQVFFNFVLFATPMIRACNFEPWLRSCT
jgi:hypothetical protein